MFVSLRRDDSRPQTNLECVLAKATLCCRLVASPALWINIVDDAFHERGTLLFTLHMLSIAVNIDTAEPSRFQSEYLSRSAPDVGDSFLDALSHARLSSP